MKARPIPFSASMVRALLEGRKTQTRRLVKKLPPPCDHTEYNRYSGREIPTDYFDQGDNTWACKTCGSGALDNIRCPHGKPGDLLWVREAWAITGDHADASADYLKKFHDPRSVFRDQLRFRADANGYDEASQGWRPSMFMYQWASRLTLDIKAVRIERLNAITWQDAEAEGAIAKYPSGVEVADYKLLWESINGTGSWETNPWVWVITFDVIKENADSVLNRLKAAA